MSLQKLNEFLKKHPAISVWSKTPIGSGCNHGIKADLHELIESFGESEIEDWQEKEEEKEAWFRVGHTSYCLTVAEFPTDKWGNTGTYESRDLKEGYFEFAWSDDTMVLIDSDWENLLEEWNDSPDKQEFLAYIEEEYPDLVSTIGEELVCNGSCSTWTAYTTNKPADSPEWREAVSAFVKSQSEENDE